MPTPDHENWDTLKKHAQYVGFGRTQIELTIVNGFLTGWEELSTKRGHRAPLKKEKEDDES